MSQIPEFDDYPFDIAPLTEEEGGGFLITWADLPGCMSDGETIDAAIANGRDAFEAWMAVHIEDDRPIPEPGYRTSSGRFVQRVPKSLHARLASRARSEGVSMNTLVATMLAEGLGVRESRQ